MRARWLVVALVLAGAWACRRAAPPAPVAEVRVGDWARYSLAYEQVRGEERTAISFVTRLQVVALEGPLRLVLITFESAGTDPLPPPFQRPLLLRVGERTRVAHQGATAEACEGAGRRWSCSCWKVDQRGYDGPRSLGCLSNASELAVGSGVVTWEEQTGGRFRLFRNEKGSLIGYGHDETLPSLPTVIEPHAGNQLRKRFDNEQGSWLDVSSWANSAEGLEQTQVRWQQAPSGADGGVVEADGRTFVAGSPVVGHCDALGYVQLLAGQWSLSPSVAEGDAGQVELDGHLVQTVTVTRGGITETFAADPWALPAMREVQFMPVRSHEGSFTMRVLSAK